MSTACNHHLRTFCTAIALSSSLLMACRDASSPAAPSVAAAQAAKPPPAQHTAEQLAKATAAGKVVIAYLDAQISLAADDVSSARARFTLVRDSARAANAITDDALRKRIDESAQAGVVAKDIAAARVAFDKLSRAMIEWLRVQPNPLDEKLHLANCPMAFNSGAKWLQASDKVANPYYGSEMLTCGSIDAALAPGAKLATR